MPSERVAAAKPASHQSKKKLIESKWMWRALLMFVRNFAAASPENWGGFRGGFGVDSRWIVRKKRGKEGRGAMEK